MAEAWIIMRSTLGLIALTVTFLVSIYLIAKGVETLLRGLKADNPNRTMDLIVGAIMFVPGCAAGIFGYFWLYPWVR